jgi:ribosomal-protein-alanine N-acetyltransferase
MALTRLVTLDDVAALAQLVTENRAYLAPWWPVQPETYFTEAGQHAVLARDLAAHERGTMLPLAVLADGAVCGRVSLQNIVRGAFQNASLGYWVSQAQAGRGRTSTAVAEAVEAGFGELGLHRLDAATLVHNAASQHVLARNQFRPFAVAESYLKIDGRWQDHLLFQRLNPAA